VLAAAAVTALSVGFLYPKKEITKKPVSLYGQVIVEELKDPRLAEASLPHQWKEIGEGNWFKEWGNWKAAVFAKEEISVLLINSHTGQSYYYRFAFSPLEVEVKDTLYVRGKEGVLVVGEEVLGRTPYMEVRSLKGNRVFRTTFY